jgi:hypothetical protein
MRIVLAGMFAVLIAGPVMAAGETVKAKAPEPGTSVEMPYLIAPVVVGATLVAYAYISSKIIASSPQTAIDIRLATPFIQDAFVRDVNATPIGKASDPSTVDSVALTARLLADARRIVGAGKVAGLALIQIQMAPLRPNPQG